MCPRGQPTFLFALVFVLFAGLLAGCGGGEQSGGGSQDGKGSGAEEKKEEKEDAGATRDAGAGNKARPQPKIALGTIVATEPEAEPHGKIVLRPTAGVQGGRRMIFKPLENARITLNGKEAELADIQAGQQAQIRYSLVRVTYRDTNESRWVNRARVVQVFGGEEGNEGG